MSNSNSKKNAPNGKAKAKAGAKKPTVKEMVALPVDENAREVRKKEAYVAFIRWDISTKAERKANKDPKTQKEFAAKWDIAEDTIVDWKARADFQKLRGEMFKKKLAAEVPEVMADMRKRIKKIGKADEVELWLAYAEGWDKKRVLEIKPPVEFGEGDIRLLVSKLPPERQKHFRVTLAELLAEAEAANDNADAL